MGLLQFIGCGSSGGTGPQRHILSLENLVAHVRRPVAEQCLDESICSLGKALQHTRPLCLFGKPLPIDRPSLLSYLSSARQCLFRMRPVALNQQYVRPRPNERPAAVSTALQHDMLTLAMPCHKTTGRPCLAWHGLATRAAAPGGTALPSDRPPCVCLARLSLGNALPHEPSACLVCLILLPGHGSAPNTCIQCLLTTLPPCRPSKSGSCADGCLLSE